MTQYAHATSHGSPLRRLGAALALAIATTLILGATHATAQPVDLRSPDARDAAGQTVDLRSPDARPSGRFVPQQSQASSDGSSGDFGWAYLAVGVAGMGLVGGAVTLTVHRRHRATRAASA